MYEQELQTAVASLPLGGLRYFKTIGSTNDEALAWAAQGAPDLSLIIADEQTTGRGRSGRKWFTPPEAALAFSLILRPTAAEHSHPARITGLGALALTDALHTRGLAAQIKWPNDILVHGRKAGGILVEAVWTGDSLDALVLGMGVNVRAASVPPADKLLFPATSIEAELGLPIERAELFGDILARLIGWRARLGAKDFMQAWEEALAFRGEQVEVQSEGQPPLVGKLLGLQADGGLRLTSADGHLHTVQFGEVHLRPAL
jgi:BirA family biotin operon repressor/biotin-[acetyl-CoA-carboxylase] ligase